jgi:hypothetical protein
MIDEWVSDQAKGVPRTWGLGHETDSRVGEDIMYQLLLTEAEPKEKYG